MFPGTVTSTNIGSQTVINIKLGCAFMLGKSLAAFGGVGMDFVNNNPDGGTQLSGTVFDITLGLKAFF